MSMTESRFALTHEKLTAIPLTFREDLFAGQVVLVSGAGSGLGKAAARSSLLFVSRAFVDAGGPQRLGLERTAVAVANTRGGIGKHSMIHNSATPHIEVDAETYEVRADGQLLTCPPATVLPMAQRYFLF